MGTSIIDEQKHNFLTAIQEISGNDWKVLVVDDTSKKLLFNVTKEDDILNCNIINIEQLEDRRETQPDTEAIYLLSPLPHIIEALKADLSRRRYKRAFLVWTSRLPRHLGEELFRSESRRQLIADTRDLNIDFYPRESHLVTFRAPWSFHVLYNPHCDSLVKAHLDSITQKIVSVCVSLGEYPVVKYYRPKTATHAAAVLCTHLASFVQGALDDYARDQRNNFPPPSPRPQGVLLITDRTMDLMAPFVHELTYQAMAMDLLPIQDDGDKVTYRNMIRRGQPDQEEKDFEINEHDKLWVENRHLHMKDLLVKLSNDFKRFQAKNSQFAEAEGTVSVNKIKDMLAGLPEFQEGKEAFGLHIDMAEKCAKIFQERKLLDLTSVEQCLATGVDEDGRKPKNLADQVVRMLDDDSAVHDDRVRLLCLYILYRNGILRGDIEKLRCHGQMSPMDGEMIYNLDTLGARVERQLKDSTPPPPPLFPPRIQQNAPGDEISLSRFEPNLRYVLEGICQNTLDPLTFPPVKPHLDNSASTVSQTSLRSASKPTWANTRSSATKPRQRIIVFIGGGATYSEARACYEVSRQFGREVFLSSTHMTTPKMFARHISLLSRGRRELALPGDKAPPQLPAWMSEAPPQHLQPKQPEPSQASNGRPSDGVRPLTDAMKQTKLDPQQQQPQTSARPTSAHKPDPPKSTFKAPTDMAGGGKLQKDKKDKKHFGMFKKH